MSESPLTLNQLPLFPLQTVLFPGGWMPLRIFEVRYLDMIKRCHAAGAPFGVVCLSEGSEVRRADPASPDGFAHEAFHQVGTIARIEQVEHPPGLRAVTVLAPSCLLAGIYSTCVFILGLREGLLFADRAPGVEACAQDEHGPHATREFRKFQVQAA